MNGLFPQQPTPRRGRFKDITGQKFGRLTVVQFMGVPTGKNQKAHWLCVCSCPQKTQIILSTSAMRTSNTSSCGCLRREISAQRATKHGFHGTPEYQAFCDMLERCYNPNHSRFKDWGGRGITVDEKWNTTPKFDAFMAEVGPRPSPLHTIDRIDNNGGYVSGNMRWATRKQQSRNRRDNLWLLVNGQRMCLTEASEMLGLSLYKTRKFAELGLSWSGFSIRLAPPKPFAA